VLFLFWRGYEVFGVKVSETQILTSDYCDFRIARKGTGLF